LKVFKLNTDKAWDEQPIARREGKTVCVSRYGAFGDMIQMSSILPELKKQGYKVCVNTTPKGQEILRNDPNIDEFFVQEDNQVPNKELDRYWAYLAGKFEKFICLSESVEGALLAMPGRKEFRWAKEFRDMVMGVNYLEGIHALSGVPFHPAPKFYRSAAEKKWSSKYRAKLGLNNFVIMWSIAGSSVHKIYPHMNTVMARMLHQYKDVKFILVGDHLSSVVEYHWTNEKRVIRKCGKWSIRESLSMAKECDLVIGPETGVMNAVSFEAMPKILLLSHSSRENIGKHWKQTAQIEPTTDCYPCHQLHFGFDTCQRDEETGTAKCAASIDPYIETLNVRRGQQHE
jgi:ADP-heptose:LPS heptosyltransferase